MKRSLIAAASVLFLCIGFAFWFPHKQKQKVDAWHFIQPEISLGTISKDRVVPITFDLKNETDTPIKIASAEETCRCTTLDSAPDQIPAHGVGSFTFIFVAASSLGLVTHGVEIEAEDGRTIDGTFTAMVEETPPAAGGPKAHTNGRSDGT